MSVGTEMVTRVLVEDVLVGGISFLPRSPWCDGVLRVQPKALVRRAAAVCGDPDGFGGRPASTSKP